MRTGNRALGLSSIFTLLVLFTLPSCNNEKSEIGKPVLIRAIESEANVIVGTVQGVRIDQQYFSSLFLLDKQDTILSFNDYGITGNEIDFPTDMEAYDGYEIEFEDPHSFVVWVSKRGGASSDGAFVKWNESLKAFTFSLAGPPEVLK